MVYLKEVNYDDIEKEYSFVQDMPMDENGFTNEWHGILRRDFEEAVEQMIAYAKGIERKGLCNQGTSINVAGSERPDPRG